MEASNWARRGVLLGALAFVGSAACAYTSPVVAPPMRIDPSLLDPPPFDERPAVSPEFLRALLDFSEVVRELRAAPGAEEPTLVREAFRRLGVAIEKIPRIRAYTGVAQVTAALQRDDVWLADAARTGSWRGAAVESSSRAANALGVLAAGPYRSSPEVTRSVDDLERAAAELARTPGTSYGPVVDVLGRAEHVLAAIYTELARSSAP